MPYRVVVADDEILVALQMQRLMASLGHELVGRAGTGREAVDLCCALRPDLVTMDVRMPEMDGLAATRRLAELCPTCVVVVAGSPDFEQAAAEAGAMAYVLKPAHAGVASTIEMAHARFDWFEKIRERTGEVDGTLKTWGLAWSAVKVLMREQGLSEAEACDELKRRAGR